MADSKKYDGSQWEHSLRKQTTASEIIVPPTTIYADGTAISTYTIKGNTVQSGTPTPSNPVDVNGVGERTANLLSGWIKGVRLDPSTGVELTAVAEACTTDYIAVDNTKTYIVKPLYVNYNSFVAAYNASKQFLGRTSATNRSGATFDSTSFPSGTPQGTGDIAYIRITIYNAGSQTGDIDDAIALETMLNEGSTVLPYEPYGYKIPILSGGVTTPIYLTEPLMEIGDTADSLASSGTVTYNIKKLVLTGEENWKKSSTYDGSFYAAILSNSTSPYQNNILICTHAVHVNPINSTTYTYGKCGTDRSQGEVNVNINLFIGQAGWSVSDFQAYLAQEYTNGTPVTVYYVRATPTTEQITAPSIPTTDGANSITVDTTVQPSEVSMTWTGWHDSSVKEYDGTDWQ